MGETAIQRAARIRQRELLRAIGAEVHRLRLDAGLSLRRVAAAAGVDHSHVSRIEAATRWPSLETLVAVHTALGSELSVRGFPAAGPRARDHLQARMEEAALVAVHARWRPFLEVAVYRAVRGVIDMALADPGVNQVLAAEHHSELRAVEHQLRWAGQKADALPSAREWPFGLRDPDPQVARLLFLRNTERSRRLVTELQEVFRAAYPIPAATAHAILTGPAGAMPGNALLWITVQGRETRLLAGPPRGIRVGR